MKKRGFTLIEMIATIAITSIVFGLIYTIYSNGNRIYKTGLSEVEIQSTAKAALKEWEDSIRTARYVTTDMDSEPLKLDVTGPDEEKLAYVRPINGEPYIIVYNRVKKELHRRYIKRIEETENVEYWTEESRENRPPFIGDILNYSGIFDTIYDVKPVLDSDLKLISVVKLRKSLDFFQKLVLAILQGMLDINIEPDTPYCYARDEDNNVWFIKLVKIQEQNSVVEFRPGAADNIIIGNVSNAVIVQNDGLFNIKIEIEKDGKQRTYETSISLRNYGGDYSE